MLSNPRVIALVAAGTLAAAAGGAYVAMSRPDLAATATPIQSTTAPRADGSLEATAPGPTRSEPLAETAAPADQGIAEPLKESPPPVVSRRAPARRRVEPRRPTSPTRETLRVAETPAPVAPEPSRPDVEMPPPAPLAEPLAEPAPRFEELTIPSDAVIGVQVDTTVSSERARVEDRVEGHVARDVSVDGRVAIPAGTRLIGSVTMVERGGKFKERARIAVRFHTARLADGSEIALQTTAIMREGDSPSRESATKVGGAAVGGAILGAILGGGKGAVIGGTAGAAGGTAVVAAGDRNPATLPAGSTVSVRLMADVTLTVER